MHCDLSLIRIGLVLGGYILLICPFEFVSLSGGLCRGYISVQILRGGVGLFHVEE